MSDPFGVSQPDVPALAPIGPPQGRGSRVLTLNRGSSSIKFAVYAGGIRRHGFWRAKWSGSACPTGADAVSPRRSGGPACDRRNAPGGGHERADRAAGRDHRPRCGGRGGASCRSSAVPTTSSRTRVTPQLLADLRSVSAYAPEHLPIQIDLIETIQAWRPSLPQVACFDTAFHADMPPRRQNAPHSAPFRGHGGAALWFPRTFLRLPDRGAGPRGGSQGRLRAG